MPNWFRKCLIWSLLMGRFKTRKRLAVTLSMLGAGGRWAAALMESARAALREASVESLAFLAAAMESLTNCLRATAVESFRRRASFRESALNRAAALAVSA